MSEFVGLRARRHDTHHSYSGMWIESILYRENNEEPVRLKILPEFRWKVPCAMRLCVFGHVKEI